jgi:long-chain acyl-CoA synthetase
MGDAGTLVSLVRECMDGPERPILAERVDGPFVTTTTRQLLGRVEAVAHGLWERGICPGDRIALMSPNRIDWIVANLAILSVGGVTVPLYPTQALDHAQIILDDSQSRLLFLDSEKARRRLTDGGVRLPDTVLFDGTGDDGLAALERAGSVRRDAQPDRLREYAAGIKPDDLAVLIYTSGTTGVPKGVMLSHRNIASTAVAGFSTITDVLPAGEPVLSVLPWAHIYEHTDLYGFFLRGALIYVCHSPDELLADLQAVRPVVFFAVPRIFERMIAGVIGKAKAEGGLKARLVPWALGVGRDYMRATLDGGSAPSGLRAQYALAKALVLKKLRPGLGLDRLNFIGSGSAPLHLDLALMLAAADITILEGYGLTECSPVVSVNTPELHRLGTVGRPLAGVEVRLADDGELLVRGPNVMQGYYHDPEATAATIRDGWLGTGDIAAIDAQGFIRITDRKKELFKTSGGKFVAPARVESAILRSPFVNQVMVLGNGRAHPVALVSPNWPLLRHELNIAGDMLTAEASTLPKVCAFMTREAVANTADLAPHEQIRRVGVFPHDLTVDDNELSPTLKVRRRVVEQRYADLIEAAYSAPATSSAQAIPA